MRIGVDTNAVYVTPAGTARYVRGLLRGLRRVAPPAVALEEVAWPVDNLAFRQPHRALKTLWRELVWARWIAPGLIARRHLDVFHSTAMVLVDPPPGVRRVATIHDLSLLRFPERFRPWNRRTARRALSRLADMDRVICISESTAQEAHSLLGLPTSRLVVVHNGCDFQGNDAPPAEAPPREPIPDEFVLFVGSLEPGKNLALLRHAYTEADQRGRRLPPLVIVGVRWEGLAHEGPPPADWLYLGRQPDAALVYLYRRALALAYPSKYEGFGLPVAEAMALGCPVICSPVSSLPEVGGDAAWFVEPTPAAYDDAIRGLARDPARRDEMKRRGLVQARRFTWDRCASETLAVYAAR